MQLDPQQLHEDKGTEHRQRQYQADQQAAAQAHEDQQHANDDDDREDKADDKALDRSLHFIGLVVEELDLHTGRSGLIQFGKTAGHSVADIHDIDMTGKGHAKPDGTLTVGAIEVIRLLGKTATDLRNITQYHALGAARLTDNQPLQFTDALKLTGRMQTNGLTADQHAPGIRHHVLVTQQIIQPRRGNAQTGHARAGYFDKHLFLRQTRQRDLAHARHQHQLTAQIVGKIAQLAVTEGFTADHQKSAVDITEIITNDGVTDPGRQIGAQIINAPAHFIPDLRQLLRTIGGLDFHGNLRQPGAGNRADLVHIGQLLDGVLQRISDLFLDLLR